MHETVEVVVESPRGSKNRFEVDGQGRVRFDRRLPAAFAFPADYGYVPEALGSNGEPLDALVLMVEPTHPGVRVRARAIGVFWVITGHGREAKLVCVPDGDPAHRDVHDLAQVPEHQLQEIAHFFDLCRDLDPGKDVRFDGRDGATVAVDVLDRSRRAGERVSPPDGPGGGTDRQTRWVTAHRPGHAQWYVERFRRLAAEGADLAGEARLVDAMVPRRARVLDSGCGPGRVGAELAARGHVVVGVDADRELIEAAEVDHPGPTWLVADLAELDLPAAGHPEPFDAAVVAGNVMPFLAPGTERIVLERIGAHLHPDGIILVGFGTDRGYPLPDFDADVAAVGLVVEHRFATWDLRPWHDDAPFAVTVLRRPP